MKNRIGKFERQMFAAAQARETGEVRQGDLRDWLGLSPEQERGVFHRLSAAGWIARVRRGLYLVPPRLTLGGKWSPDEAQALNALVGDKGGRYQICGPNAFQRYGFDSQIPTRVFAYNDSLSGERGIGSVTLKLIKVADTRLGGTETSRMASGAEAVYSSRARTLVDAVDDWALFGSLPRAYGWFRQAIASGKVGPGDLAEMALKYGNQACLRRLGCLLQKEGVAEPILKKIAAGLRKTTGLIPWDPTAGRKGRIDRRWGVIINGR